MLQTDGEKNIDLLINLCEKNQNYRVASTYFNMTPNAVKLTYYRQKGHFLRGTWEPTFQELEELKRMKDQGMSWGQIAHQKRLTPDGIRSRFYRLCKKYQH